MVWLCRMVMRSSSENAFPRVENGLAIRKMTPPENGSFVTGKLFICDREMVHLWPENSSFVAGKWFIYDKAFIIGIRN